MKYREQVKDLAGSKDYLTISEVDSILDDIEWRVSEVVDQMNHGLEYLVEAFKDLFEIQKDLH